MKQYQFSICFATCYIGQQFPAYFEYFLQTAAWNASVNFLVFSNIQPAENSPSNVRFVHIDLEGVKELASQKMGIPVSMDTPYKLCDFKPAYGLLFEAHLKEYDFWGYMDIDILLGNIRHFLPDSLLEANDFITTKEAFPSDFLSLYRNNDAMRTLFMQSKDWQKVYGTPEYFGFDQCNFAFAEMNEGKSILEIPTAIESMAAVLASQNVRSYMAPISHELQYRELLEVSANGINRIGKEGQFMVVHFVGLNRHPLYEYKKMSAEDDRFYIDVFGIVPCNSQTVLTIDGRNEQILNLPVRVNYNKIIIGDNGSVSSITDRGERFVLSDSMLLNTQLLLLIHHQQGITGKEIVDFFVKSKLFTIQKAVPPTPIEIEMLILNLLSRLMEVANIIIQA